MKAQSLFNVFYFNICSVRNKTGEIESFLAEGCDFDLLCFSEHCLLKQEVDLLKISNYQVVSYFCRESSAHGGSIILSKPHLTCLERRDLVDCSLENHCEIAAVEIKSLNFLILTIYRPPSGNVGMFLEVLSNVISKLKTKYFIVINGDFNVHFNRQDNRASDLLDLMRSFGFREQVFSATRILNTLDNVFLNFQDRLNSKVRVINPWLSDHSAVSTSIELPGNSPKPMYQISRPFTDHGKILLYNFLSQVDWTFANLRSLSVDTRFDLLLQTVTTAMNVVFPRVVKVSTRDSQIRWFNGEIRQKRETLRLLSEMHACRPSDCLRELIKLFRAHYRQAIMEAKQNANANFINKSGNIAKSSWQLIKINSNRVANKHIDTRLKAEDFNNFFIDIPKNLIHQISNSNNSQTNYKNYIKSFMSDKNIDTCFSFQEVSQIKIRDTIRNLKNKPSRDIYDINVGLVKYLQDILVGPLTTLINLAIREKTFPKCFKISKVIPIPKGGDLDDPNNFRPIALIPVLSRIYESILREQLYSYFESGGLFSTHQFGFREGKSTTQAVLKMLEDVVDSFEKKEYMRVVCCDLSKAFDCVSHGILLEKLTYYGITQESIGLIESYLTDRTQQTYFDSFSNSATVEHGVPQGSLLAPLLFLIYINDIEAAVPTSGLSLFADDTALSYRDQDYNRLIARTEESLRNLEKWFACNQLCLNMAKTTQITFTLRQLADDGNVPEIKFLGIHLDTRLSFQQHVECVAARLSKTIFLLRNLRNLVPFSVVLQAYHGLFQSVACYAIMAWGHSCHAERIFGLQRKALRAMNGLGYRSDVKEKFVELKILTIPSRFIYECLLYTYNNLHNLKRNNHFHDYDTRLGDNVRHDFLRLQKSRLSINYYCIKFYNKLSNDIKRLPINQYKTELKKQLISKAVYSFDEFLLTDL